LSRNRINEAHGANFIRRGLESGSAREAAKRIAPNRAEAITFLIGQ
jgi:DNA-binding GntR family transcriptional regulator